MRRPLAYSLLLHATVFLIAVVAAFLPSSTPLFVEEPLNVELVSIGEKTSPPPAVAREPRPEPAKPSPPPPRPEAESKPDPEPRPAPAAKSEPEVQPPPSKPEPAPKPAAKPEPAPKPEPVVKAPPAPPKPPEPVAKAEPPPKPEAPPKPTVKPAPAEAERKPEPPKVEPPKPEPPKPVVTKAEPEAKPVPKPEPPKPVPPKPEPPKVVPPKPEPPKASPEKPTPEKPAPEKPATEKQAPPKPEPPSDFASVVKSVQELKQAPAKAGEQPQAKPKAADGEPSLEQRLAQALRSPTPAASTLAQPMTMSEIDAIRRQIERCWNLPAGAKDAENLVVAIRVEMNSDGRPRSATVENQAEMRSNPFFRSAAESALRAVLNPRCHPFKLPAEKYERWKSMTLVFNPKEMAGT